MAIKGELRNNIASCKIGDYIKLKYTASSNTIGEFSIPTENDSELYVYRVSSTDMTTSHWTYSSGNNYVYYNAHVPNGTFYAVCIDKVNGFKVFFPDRIIQRYISYNTINSSGMIDNTYKINTNIIIGSAQIMSYEEIQKYLPILKEICEDYRYDLGIPALGHTLGGGYYDSLVSFNTADGTYAGIDCLEMTRDLSGEKVRYIADYERWYNDAYLYVGSERGSVYIAIPRYFNKDYVQQNFYHDYVACVTSSAIRPLLYLQDNGRQSFQNENNMYGILKKEIANE